MSAFVSLKTLLENKQDGHQITKYATVMLQVQTSQTFLLMTQNS